MKTIKKVYGSSKTFVSNHKTGLAFVSGAAVATAGIIAMSAGAKAQDALFGADYPTDVTV